MCKTRCCPPRESDESVSKSKNSQGTDGGTKSSRKSPSRTYDQETQATGPVALSWETTIPFLSRSTSPQSDLQEQIEFKPSNPSTKPSTVKTTFVISSNPMPSLTSLNKKKAMPKDAPWHLLPAPFHCIASRNNSTHFSLSWLLNDFTKTSLVMMVKVLNV